MLYIALTAVSALLYCGGCSALTCHCLNNAQCNPIDGSCSSGCEMGWYGPGCQIGNLAFKRKAFQSTTYASFTADNAVDGIVPPQGDVTENSCSHTSESKYENLWWYVILSDSEDFVIKNVTIVNRQGENGAELRNFYILYTSDENSNPDPTSWNQCTFTSQPQSSTVAIYTCNSVTAIGRRVAVYMIPDKAVNSIAKLALCEVYVDGFSYNATSTFQDVATSITATCDSMVIKLSTLPIVPPTNLIVQLKSSSESNVMFIQRIRNTLNGLSSLTVLVMANRTYSVSVAPETCCIGSQCLENFDSDPSKCIAGKSTIPAIVTMPQYTQYALRKTGKVISITSLNEYFCSSTNKSVRCHQLSPPYNSTENCISNSSCELDPRYNYICALTILFSDGFNQTSLEKYNVRIANFSTVNIHGTMECNSITMVLENITTMWDVEPSLIEFYVASAGSDDTAVARVVANATGLITANFSVKSNNTYIAWAIPITYLSNNHSPETFYESCNNSKNCIVGERTPERAFITLQRKYNLTTEGCCASLADLSPTQCEAPVSYKINCSGGASSAGKVLASQSASVCGLKPNVFYACNHTVYLRSGQTESYNHFVKIGNQSSGPPIQEEQYKENELQNTSAAIGGSVAGLVILIGVTASLAVLQRRRHNLTRGSNVIQNLNVNEQIAVYQNDAEGVGKMDPHSRPSVVFDCVPYSTDLSVHYNVGALYGKDQSSATSNELPREGCLPLPDPNGVYASLTVAQRSGKDADYAVLILDS